MPDSAPPPAAPQGLASALRAAMDARGIETASDLARILVDPQTGRIVSTRQAIHGWLNPHPAKPLINFLESKTYRALGAALNAPPPAFYLPTAVTIGLGVPKQSIFASLLPGVIDQLPAEDLQALQATAIQMCRARGLLPG
jgi:hypothetical protein